MKEVYFPQTWAKFAENGNLDQKDAYRFVKDLMTEPVTKKDDSVKEHSEAKASKKISILQKSDKLQDQLDKQDK